MGKKQRILLAGLLVIVVAGFAWLVLSPHEPVYNGKPLRYWLRGYHELPHQSNIGNKVIGASHIIEFPPGVIQSQYEWHRAEEAVRHIGTNAIPTLLKLVEARDSPLKLKLTGWLRRLRVVPIHPVTAVDLNYQGVHGFVTLGADARTAAPDLIRIYERNVSAVDQAGIAAFLSQMGPASRPAIPSLLRAVTNADYDVRWTATFALGQIHAEPELVVPVLINALHDPVPGMRGYAMSALKAFRGEARQAVPALVESLETEQNEYGKRDAQEALKAIDPEAAAKAGVK